MLQDSNKKSIDILGVKIDLRSISSHDTNIKKLKAIGKSDLIEEYYELTYHMMMGLDKDYVLVLLHKNLFTILKRTYLKNKSISIFSPKEYIPLIIGKNGNTITNTLETMNGFCPESTVKYIKIKEEL